MRSLVGALGRLRRETSVRDFRHHGAWTYFVPHVIIYQIYILKTMKNTISGMVCMSFWGCGHQNTGPTIYSHTFARVCLAEGETRRSFTSLLEAAGWQYKLRKSWQPYWFSPYSRSSLPAVKDDESHFAGSWEEVCMELNKTCFNSIIALPLGCIEIHHVWGFEEFITLAAAFRVFLGLIHPGNY